MKIFLIGPMGSGKSKIGKILSEKLGVSLFDIDKEIEKDLNMPITEMFASKGEEFFRTTETNYLIKTKKINDCIISTGGGVVEKIKNLELLANETNVVFLNCSVESQFENTKDSKKRPLLQTSDPKLTLQTLYEKRLDSYKKVSKLELLSDSMSNEEIANKIINHFNV
tara:strand:- start:226 stop:729 length:504 start_codon:yes stop_codon:yes gene_type:complete